MSSVVDTSQLQEVLAAFNESANQALASKDCIAIEQAEAQLSEIEGYVRELQQAMWASEAEQTIERLEGDQPLTEIDREVIRTFLVSDAEHYLAKENNYGDWTAELQRLMKELAKRSTMVTRENIGEMRGVLKDAIRLMPDIRNFVEEQKRIERFDLAVGGLDRQTRRSLIKIIREQLYSPAR